MNGPMALAYTYLARTRNFVVITTKGYATPGWETSRQRRARAGYKLASSDIWTNIGASYPPSEFLTRT